MHGCSVITMHMKYMKIKRILNPLFFVSKYLYNNFVLVMQPTLDPKELKDIGDIWKNITDPTKTPPDDTPVTPEPYDPPAGAISKRDELEATGKFSTTEIDNILADVEEPPTPEVPAEDGAV